MLHSLMHVRFHGRSFQLEWASCNPNSIQTPKVSRFLSFKLSLEI